MLRVGLTGNIGSGKTTVSRIFSVLNIPVYHADDESRQFLQDPAVTKEVISVFGESIASSSGTIDKAKLGLIVFNDSRKLSQLTKILHPLVIEDFRKWCMSNIDRVYVIHEAAIIFESGVEKDFDKIIHVSCPKEIAIRRVIDRDGTTRDEILKRMQFQIEDDEKAIKSDYIIRNDGLTLLIPQVLTIHRILSEGSS